MIDRFNLKVDPSKFNDEITAIFQQEIRERIKQTIKALRKRVIDTFYECLTEDSETYEELNNAFGLQGELGVVDYYVAETAAAISKMISLETIPPTGKNLGGFRLTFVKGGMESILSLPYAQYETNKGVTIPWLQWLLTAGNSILISDYIIGVEKDFGKYSRTGMLIMMPKKGGSFSIDAQNSGTENHNWITKAIAQAQPRIERMLMGAIQ